LTGTVLSASVKPSGFCLDPRLLRKIREPGSEQGGHPVGAPNVLTPHPGFGLFHQPVSPATSKLLSQPAAGGGVEAQTGCIEAPGRILEELTRRADIVPPDKGRSIRCWFFFRFRAQCGRACNTVRSFV
jgi:hypothetical protein